MRILHVTDCYLPELGGIETQVADLVRHQSAAGHDVQVVTRTPDSNDRSTHVHRVPAGWLHGTFLGSARSMHAVRGLRPDVVHCHNSVLSPLAVAVAGEASALGFPTAVTVHSMLPEVGPLLPLSGALLGVRAAPIAWSAVSEVAAAPVRQVVGKETTVDILSNAVDVGWWRDASRPQRSPDTAEVRVVTVGRLAIRKRPLALIEMMGRVRQLVRADVPLRLVLVGDGPQRRRVERRIRDLEMSDWVDMPGRLSRRDIRDVLAAADVYAAPANLESFGIAALEARSVGLPVVAKLHGGVGEFVSHGTDGILATTDDEVVLALASLASSTSLREGIRAHNCAAPPAFGWDDALARTHRLYGRAQELVRRSRPLERPTPVLPIADIQVSR
jgi:glycosyltransferase involved in cell wall biosynthesis